DPAAADRALEPTPSPRVHRNRRESPRAHGETTIRARRRGVGAGADTVGRSTVQPYATRCPWLCPPRRPGRRVVRPRGPCGFGGDGHDRSPNDQRVRYRPMFGRFEMHRIGAVAFEPSGRTAPEPKWLTASQQRAWRAYMDGHQRLMEELNRQLQRDYDLS